MKKKLIMGSTILSVLAAVIYFLTGAGVIPYAGDFSEISGGPPFFFPLAGAFYILVGYLVRIEKRWLSITLSVINALVIVIFFQMWAAHPDVLTSPAGLGTKIPQFLLEIGLIYLALPHRQTTGVKSITAG